MKMHYAEVHRLAEVVERALYGLRRGREFIDINRRASLVFLHDGESELRYVLAVLNEHLTVPHRVDVRSI